MGLKINSDGSFSDTGATNLPLPTLGHSQPPAQTSSPQQNLHPAQFRAASVKQTSPDSTGKRHITGSMGSAGKLPVYGNLPDSIRHTKHGKPYDVQGDIDTLNSKRKRSYQGKHTEAAIKARNASKPPDKKVPNKPLRFHLRPSKHEGKNAERLKAMAGGKTL